MFFSIHLQISNRCDGESDKKNTAIWCEKTTDVALQLLFCFSKAK